MLAPPTIPNKRHEWTNRMCLCIQMYSMLIICLYCVCCLCIAYIFRILLLLLLHFIVSAMFIFCCPFLHIVSHCVCVWVFGFLTLFLLVFLFHHYYYHCAIFNHAPYHTIVWTRWIVDDFHFFPAKNRYCYTVWNWMDFVVVFIMIAPTIRYNTLFFSYSCFNSAICEEIPLTACEIGEKKPAFALCSDTYTLYLLHVEWYNQRKHFDLFRFSTERVVWGRRKKEHLIQNMYTNIKL